LRAMNIKISNEFFEEFISPKLDGRFPLLEEAKKSFELYKSKAFDLPVDELSIEELQYIYNLAKEATGKESNSIKTRLTPIINILKDSSDTKVTNLMALTRGLKEYLKRDSIDGWLYEIGSDGIPLPYLVRRVAFHDAFREDDRPYVSLEIEAHSHKTGKNGGTYRKTLTFDTDDIRRTIGEILRSKGLYKETPELKESYLQHLALFQEYQPQFNKQFRIEGKMLEDSYYREVTTSVARAVNDEELISRSFNRFVDAYFWRNAGVTKGFDEVPFHCYIYLFHLEVHTHVWVHVTQMSPYQYDVSLRDKLILPQTHRDLIDILTSDMEILQEDIIKGKSGGTTILCEGKAGLGKTLSAEVYSEVVKRPLYRVHSGQLGLSADNVEKNLEKILKRASRWGAVLLIDEADVYIRQRGDDLHHNAVVASFLRTLEYFDGLLFMTTNRGDDVDDAILSRCIAVIKYKTPTPEDAKKIWRVLVDQFTLKLSDDLIDELVEKFPESSGRDIKELLKLTSRFAKGKEIPLDIEAFRKCAQFRGMTMKGN